MTLKIRRSKVYGTEDWFDGEPDVYSITETDADCLPEVSLMTRNILVSRSGGYLPCDQVPTPDFSIRTNVTCTKIATLEGASTSTGYKVISSNDYLYWTVGGNNNVLSRYHIGTGVQTDANVGRAVTSITLIDENIICYMSTESNSHNMYLYNFETTDNDLLCSMSIYPDDYTAKSYIYGFMTYVHDGVAKTLLVVIGVRLDLDFYNTGYCFLRVYNHSTNTFEDYDAMVPSRAGDGDDLGNTWYFYGEPVLIDNKMIWGGVFDDFVDTNYEMPVFVYDFDGDTFTRYAIPMSETWGTDGPYNAAIDRTNHKVYFNAYYRQDEIDLSIMEWDVATNTGQWILDLSGSYDYLWPFTGTKAAILATLNSANDGDVFYADDLDTTLFTTGNYVPGIVMDDGSGILWTVNRTGQQLVGYPLDGSTPIVISTNIATNYNDYVLSIHGNKIIVIGNKLFSPRKVSIYLIRNVEA